MKRLLNIIKKNAFGVILTLSICLMFFNLGDRILNNDETQTTLVAKNILKFGVPTFYDGKNLIMDNPFNRSQAGHLGTKLENFDINKKSFSVMEILWEWQPWVQFYMTAIPLFVFGLNEFMLRFVFALFGVLTVFLLYKFVIKLTANKNLAIISTLLLALYTPFYLYSRQIRYYAVASFLVLCILYSYLKIINSEKKGLMFFIVSNILLFHTFYMSFFSIYFTIIIHFLLFKFNKKLFWQFIKASTIIFIFTFPWFVFANLGGKSYGIDFFHAVFGSLHTLFYLLIYTFPLIFCLFIPNILLKRKNGKLALDANYSLIILLIIISVAVNTFGPWYLPAFRYLAYLFPLFMILSAKVILKIRKYNYILGVIILLMFIFSNFLSVLPLKLFEPLVLNRMEKDSEPYLFIKDNLKIKFHFSEYLYEITHNYKSPNSYIIEYLNKNGGEDDVFMTNADYKTIVLYTNMIFYMPSMNISTDWIIPRKPYSLWDEKGIYDFVTSKIDKNYQNINFNSTDYIYPLDSPHPRTHRFRLNHELKTSKTYPFETYPVIIYKRINEK